jgi:hypothetical protein
VTKFEGTWLNGSDRKFSFSAYQWEYSETSQNLLNSGNFTFTDTAITFTPQLGSTWTQNYTLENNSLNLEQPQPQNGGYAWGKFVKQP